MRAEQITESDKWTARFSMDEVGKGMEWAMLDYVTHEVRVIVDEVGDGSFRYIGLSNDGSGIEYTGKGTIGTDVITYSLERGHEDVTTDWGRVLHHLANDPAHS
jgi:hypothetical protein